MAIETVSLLLLNHEKMDETFEENIEETEEGTTSNWGFDFIDISRKYKEVHGV